MASKEEGILAGYFRRASRDRRVFARKVMRVNKSNEEDVEKERKFLYSARADMKT
jgi:hypothetical protein